MTNLIQLLRTLNVIMHIKYLVVNQAQNELFKMTVLLLLLPLKGHYVVAMTVNSTSGNNSRRDNNTLHWLDSLNILKNFHVLVIIMPLITCVDYCALHVNGHQKNVAWLYPQLSVGRYLAVYAHLLFRVCVLVTQSCLTLCDPMDYSPPGSLCPRNSPGRNTGVGCHFPLQGIFPNQGSNPVLLITGRLFTVWVTEAHSG